MSRIATPPGILGGAAFKTVQVDVAKITEMLGDAVSDLTGWKGPVEAASTAALTLSGEQTIDGVAVVAGELVLVKDQSDTIYNGIYVCKADAWERSNKMATGTSAAGVAIYVTKGTANGDKVFVCTKDVGADVVGTNTLTFATLTTSPAGTDTQVQFNDGLVMAGDSGLTFNKTTDVLTVVGGVSMTKGTVASAGVLPSTATVTAKQGFITVISTTIATDVTAALTITATGLVTTGSLIFAQINTLGTDGALIVNVKTRSADSFVLNVTNASASSYTGAFTIGYMIV